MLLLLAIPLTFSIAEGIGLITTAILALATGHSKKVTTLGYFLAGIFLLQFFKVWPFGS